MKTGTGALGFFLVLAAVVVSSASASAETQSAPRFRAETKTAALSAVMVKRVSTPTTPALEHAPAAMGTATTDSAPRITRPSLLENPKLRRMHKAEISPAMLAAAARIVRQHYSKPAGTQIELDVEGQHLYARIEVHYHPEGGSVKPWGFHHGVSLFSSR
jgi:hypothetical protein